MNKHYNIDTAKAYFSERGYTLLETEWIRGDVKMECLCICGKLCMLSLYAVRHGYKCKSCQYNNTGQSKGYNNGRLKRTTAEVAAYFKEQGCELLDEYKRCDIHMKYRCSCGNISKIKWGSFLDGRRCGCKTAIKTTFEQVKKVFADNSCELLETEYTDQYKKLKYRCKCGEIAYIRYATMKRNKSHCINCRSEKNSGINAFNYIEDREALAQRNKFKIKCHGLLRHTLKMVGKSKDGHTYEILGYSPRELQNHIENHPNWDRVKNEVWHIDHMFPIYAFVEAGIYDISLINSLDNLQPLSATENLSKNAKYSKDKFFEWLKSKNVSLNEIGI